MRAPAHRKGFDSHDSRRRIRDHQERCQPYLLRLRMIVRGEAEAALSRPVAAKVGQSTNAIIAEEEAPGRAALAAAMRPPERSRGFG